MEFIDKTDHVVLKDVTRTHDSKLIQDNVDT